MSYVQNRRLSLAQEESTSTDTPGPDNIHLSHHPDITHPNEPSSHTGNTFEPHMPSPLLHEAVKELQFPMNADPRVKDDGRDGVSGGIT